MSDRCDERYVFSRRHSWGAWAWVDTATGPRQVRTCAYCLKKRLRHVPKQKQQPKKEEGKP